MATDLAKPSCETLYLCGRKHAANGQLREAIAAYSRALKSDESISAKVWFARGMAFQQLSEYANAIYDFGYLVSKFATLPWLHIVLYNRALCFRAIGDIRRATLDCNDALELDTDFLEAMYLRGSIRKQQRQWVLALSDMNKLIRSTPSFPDAIFTRSSIWFEQECWQKAIDDTTRYLQFDPQGDTVWKSYFIRGVAAFELADYSLAIQDLSIACKLSPNNISVLLRRSEAFFAAGEFDKSNQDLEKGMRLATGVALPSERNENRHVFDLKANVCK